MAGFFNLRNMKILFLHQNYPGQFKYLAPELVKRGNDVRALTMRDVSEINADGVNVIKYKIIKNPVKEQNQYLTDIETKLIRAESCLAACHKLKSDGFNPEIIIAHPGWGEAIFIKECWPKAKLGIYSEYYYNYHDGDVGFDLEFQNETINAETKLRFKNINNWLNLEIADSAISPTKWQANSYPTYFKNKINVIHDGIDTKVCVENQAAFLILNKEGQEFHLKKGDEVVTFVNRNLEPYRGFHTLMRAIPEILKAKPLAKILIVGGNGVSYGFAPDKHKYGFENWKDLIIHEISDSLTPKQWDQIFFLGNVNYSNYLNVLQISMVHVYLTYPFVLSWSLLEAMSVGCAVVASDTAPVKEVIEDQRNGVLVNFFDYKLLAEKVADLISSPNKRAELGKLAREHIVNNYDLKTVCLPKQLNWVKSLNETKYE